MYRQLTAALLCLAPVAASAQSPAVFERTLDNGLKVLVKPDRRAPILTSQVWYRIGSSYEHGGITGVSHALEHMMFQGTPNYGPGEFSRIVAENGGEDNAFTSRDYTAYYQNLASDRLPIALALEADRMRHLTLDGEQFRRELEVIKEERRMRTDDDPQSLTYEHFNSTAYDASPYQNPVIGWPGDIAQMKVEDLRQWYRLWYAPNNAVLVVAGDVQPDEVFALAEKYFGSLKAEQPRHPKQRLEPDQAGEKRVVVKAPAREAYLLMGYKTPVVGSADASWEPYALEILASVLAGGDSARLPRELVRERQVAASAGAGFSAFARLPGLFMLEGVPAAGHTIAEVEQALRAQIERLRSDLVEPGELERVRNQVVASKVYEQDSLFYQAMMLGQLEAIGLDWRLAESYVDDLAAVTPEQLRMAARKYLVPERLTVATLDPQPLDAAAAAKAAAQTLSGGGQDALR